MMLENPSMETEQMASHNKDGSGQASCASKELNAQELESDLNVELSRAQFVAAWVQVRIRCLLNRAT